MSKRLFVKTYGCQMNVYDSARMADVLAPLGYVTVDDAEGADLVILNTCHIREKAAEKVYSELGRLARVKAAKAAAGEDMVIAVAGCVAQAEGAEIRRRAPCVDVVLGPQTYHRLPRMLAEAARSGGAVATAFPPESKFDFLPEESAPMGATAVLSVQEGCDKFCTFCVVPYTRGAEFSRPAAQILAEAKRRVAQGAREITLLGQNVNAYHGADEGGREVGLGGLIRRLAAEAGLARIRYTTSHPRDMDADLIAAHGEVPELMPYLHLPAQSGSDRVLAAMNRRYRAADYRRLVDRLRARRPDLALSSDFIVGFPGEDEADFAATLVLAREVGFAQAYCFKFSPRPGTPAADADDQVEEAVKEARLAELQAVIAAAQSAFNRVTVGRVVEVLLERPGRQPGQLVGRSPHNQAVHVSAPPALAGELVPVRIVRAKSHSLEGALADAPMPARACA